MPRAAYRSGSLARLPSPQIDANDRGRRSHDALAVGGQPLPPKRRCPTGERWSSPASSATHRRGHTQEPGGRQWATPPGHQQLGASDDLGRPRLFSCRGNDHYSDTTAWHGTAVNVRARLYRRPGMSIWRVAGSSPTTSCAGHQRRPGKPHSTDHVVRSVTRPACEPVPAPAVRRASR